VTRQAAAAAFRYAEGIAILVGTILGAGFLVLPYTALRAGIVPSTVWFLAATAAVVVLHLLYLEIVFAGGAHRLPGYARRYLGRWWGHVADASFLFGVFGGLLVYLLLGGRFLHLMIGEHLGTILGISERGAAILFWLASSLCIVANLKMYGRINLVMTITTVSILIALPLGALSHFDLRNLTIAPSASFFFPFGIVLFSLVGYLAIPELTALMEEEGVKKSLVPRLVVLGTALASILTFAFMVAVLGVSGQATTPSAIDGLVGRLPPIFVFAGLLLAFVEIATSYVIFGISVKQTLERDFAIAPRRASTLVVAVPIALYLAGITDFVEVIALLGSVWVSIDSLLILAIFNRLPRDRIRIVKLPRWGRWVLAAFFVVGAVLSLVRAA
jgi:amino acid permease